MLVRTDNILAAVEALPEFRQASTVLAFWSIKDEVPTHAFLEKWAGKKRIALPCVVGENLELREYLPGRLKEAEFGIMEPAEDSPRLAPEEVELAIIPGQRFDPEGNRKGHGKGFYDRLLPKLNCCKVGIAPAYRVVDKLIPAPWDRPVDIVITDFSLSL